jgi:hypothetical protein
MTLYEFNALDDSEKGEAVFTKGEFVVDIKKDEKRRRMLYILDTFYVDITFNQATNAVEGFRSFSSTIPLNEFLEEMPLPDFLTKL